MINILTDHVHVVTITQHGQPVSETMSYSNRLAFALQSFEKFLASSRASLALVNQVTMLPVIHFSSSGQEKWFQVDFDYIYDSEGLSVKIFLPHKAVTKQLKWSREKNRSTHLAVHLSSSDALRRALLCLPF